MRLNEIQDPAQIKRLSVPELEALGAELRTLIIETVSNNGGHLASNLGVVELTLALLATLEPPRDKIIWDVGHQSYIYKILTDRRERFATLRQQGGISGFPSRAESPYDAFGAGHASTSISAALGFAKARDLSGEDYKVAAVLGDGALTGGMVWEAINNAGVANTDLLVVLNDNEMSISPNEGAMARHFNALRSQHIYQTLEDSTERLLGSMPFPGQFILKAGKALKRGVTQWISPAHGAIFEALGFEYIGPINGHNLPLLLAIFNRVRDLKGPVLVHVVTTKGRGCEYAEHDARRYHGVGAFDATNGKLESSGKLSFSKVFGDSMIECAKQMPQVAAITAAMPDGTGLAPFSKQFPNRFFDVGIAEEHAVTFAAGLAAGGMRPVVALYSTFLQRAYDQIVHDVCLQNLPVVFAIDRAGIVGNDGATHQGVFDVSLLRHIPNLTVMAPRSGGELRAMLRYALTADGPSAIRYPRDGDPGVLNEPETVTPGKAEVLKPGSELALIGMGTCAQSCLDAAVLLAERGVSAAAVNARFVKPLDTELILRLARECGVLVTVEEHVGAGGFGSAVMELLASQGVSARVLAIALPDSFIPHGRTAAMREAYGLTAEGIAARTYQFLREPEATAIAMPR